MTVKILVPSGVLGLGFSTEALEAGLLQQPDIICIDGGSTDSGPFIWAQLHQNIPMPSVGRNGNS